MSEKKIPKIKQNLDVKQTAITGVRQLKDYLYNKRANLTHEEIDTMINNVTEKIFAFSYEMGWDDRNEVYRVLKSNRHTRIIKAYNDFYNENISSIPVHVMEKVRYLTDIAILNKYYSEDVPFNVQANNANN